MQMSATFTTDLVSPRSMNRMRREINEKQAKRMLSNEGPVRRRFSHDIKREIPETYHERGAKYTKDKLRRFGTDAPNVRTGKLRDTLPKTAVVVVTPSRGSIRLRAYWGGKAKKKKGGKGFAKQGFPEWQRQEFETLSKKEQKWMATRMKEDFLDLIEDPKYRRQRALRRGSRG